MNKVKQGFKVVLIFSFIGPWIGGMLFVLYLMAGRVLVEGIKAENFLDILQLPFMGLSGMLFIPPAFLTGIVASLLIQKRRLALILLVSLFGALFSYVYIALLFREAYSKFIVMSAAVGFFASLVCSLYILRKD